MSAEVFAEPLQKVALFEGLTQQQLQELGRRTDRVIYRPGEVLIEENAEADAAILIVSGDAVRVSGPAMRDRAEPVPTGALLGEMAMLIETVHTATVVARTSVRALRISRDDVHELMAKDAALAHHFVERIADRLKSLMDTLREVDATLCASVSALPAPDSKPGAGATTH